jgi:hypothetical protein
VVFDDDGDVLLWAATLEGLSNNRPQQQQQQGYASRDGSSCRSEAAAISNAMSPAERGSFGATTSGPRVFKRRAGGIAWCVSGSTKAAKQQQQLCNNKSSSSFGCVRSRSAPCRASLARRLVAAAVAAGQTSSRVANAAITDAAVAGSSPVRPGSTTAAAAGVVSLAADAESMQAVSRPGSSAAAAVQQQQVC